MLTIPVITDRERYVCIVSKVSLPIRTAVETLLTCVLEVSGSNINQGVYNLVSGCLSVLQGKCRDYVYLETSYDPFPVLALTYIIA
jgi:hypothetical protein